MKINSEPDQEETLMNRRNPVVKRLSLGFSVAIFFVSFIVLTQLRYEGQGLAPIYFRLTTLSDVVSFSFSLVLISRLIFLFFHPIRISSFRVIFAAIIALALLWVELGIRHTPPEEFTSEAAVVFLLLIFSLFASVFTSLHDGRTPLLTVLRILYNSAVISGFMFMIAFLYGFFFPSYSKNSEVMAFHPDAGVIFGAAVWSRNGLGERPSPTLRERIALGEELLASHAVTRLIVTGGSTLGKPAESEIARRELLRSGVDSSQIIEESASHSTFEQVLFLRDEVFKTHGWNRFVIVSDQYHLARVCEMCKFNGLNVIGSPSHIHTPILDLAYYRFRESVALLEYWFLGR
jgi:uncharacterized SAM-binding protein YcdF (DUF218 family)